MSQPRPRVVYVRLADDGGRLVPVEVYVAPDGEPLSSAVLRYVPLAEVERWASLPGPAKALRARLGAAGPDLHRAAGAYARSHGGPPRHWVDWMLTAQGEDSESQAPSIIERLPEELSQNKVRQVRGAAARLDVPERPPYGEEFYRRVA